MRKDFAVTSVEFGDRTEIDRGILRIRKGIEKAFLSQEKRIKDIKVSILRPGENDFFVNSNLDYSPIACKVRGELGEGLPE